MLKPCLVMSLPLPALFGVLVICWHQKMISLPAMTLMWGVLSLFSVAGGTWAVFRWERQALQPCLPKPANGCYAYLPPDVQAGLPAEPIDRHPLFNIFMDHMPALAFIKDIQGRYLYVNAACKAMLNLTPEQMIGLTDCELWPENIANVICLNDDHIINANQIYSTRFSVMVGDEERHHLVTKFGIHSDRQLPLLGGIAFDITERVRAEEEKVHLEAQLIQSQKMEALGTLAGGIAHDFNNLLAAMMGYVELAMLDTLPDSNVQEELDQVLKAIYRATDLVRQILKFSRKADHEREPIDLEPLVGEALKLIRATLPSTIEIKQHIAIEGAQVLANSTQLHQVFMNLCTNAAHAMEEKGGVLDVRFTTIALTAADAGQFGLTTGKYLEISISDTGHGIPKALQHRIFDPYFTTKAQGKGTGMGLAVVHSIVKSHAGAIDVDSQPGEGTCFHILFPVTKSKIKTSSKDRKPLPKGTESILLVDDEPVLADLGQQMLTRLGYHVTCCSHSEEALNLFQNDPYKFDLVITDTTMPRMTGDILASKLMAFRPDIPIILCTGYNEQVTNEKAARIGISAFLMKPLSIQDLAHTLRNTLDKGSDCSSKTVHASSFVNG